MRPSSTERGAAWVAQFELDDRPTAAALLDSIRVASADEVLGGIRGTLESYLASSPAQLPVAIFPVLAKEDMRPLPAGAKLPKQPVAFEDFDPSQDLDPAPGSEALMANLAREVARVLTDDQIVRQEPGNAITLDRLHGARVGTLVFLTDYIGSGKQVLDYLAAWYRNPRIRSWMSFGWVNVVVVAFASSAEGFDRVRNLARRAEVLVVEVAPSVSDPAEWKYAQQIAHLCRNYAKRARLKRSPLGFAGSGALFVSTLSVPNNLPAILLESVPGRWTALFARRSMTAGLSREIGGYVPDRDLAHELEIARETRLSDRFADGALNARWASHLAVLALLPATDLVLAQRTALSLPRVAEIRESLLELGLVAQSGRSTAQGRHEIERFRRRPRVITAGLQGRADPYYPRLTR